MVAKIESCGETMPPYGVYRKDWWWVMVDVEEEDASDGLTRGKELICGQLSDNALLVLLCPRCLKLNGRKW